jgi:hypothetical protein
MSISIGSTLPQQLGQQVGWRPPLLKPELSRKDQESRRAGLRDEQHRFG